MIPFIQNKNSITFFVDGESKKINRDHVNYQEIVKAVHAGNIDDIDSLLDVQAIIEEKSHGKIVVKDGNVSFNGKPLNGVIVERINESIKHGYDLTHITNFLTKLEKNPSFHSQKEAYNFLSNKNLPIDQDGDFYAYKSVVVSQRSFTDKYGREVKPGDYIDKYSGTIRNNIGDTVSMLRSEVDDNHNNHCSAGLHVGAAEYSGPEGWYHSPGDVVLVVKCNPEHIVSCPSDHNFQKLRVCEYTVVSVYKGKLNKATYSDEDELEYDPTYDIEENLIPIDVSDLRITDEISFEYEGKTRYGMVDSINQTHVLAILIDGDPSYNDDRVEYRKFDKSKMEFVNLL